MKTRLFWLGVLVIFLTSCGKSEAPLSLATLDDTRLNETAVSLVTLDFAQTQTAIPTETPTPTQTSTPIPTLVRTRPPIQTPTSVLPCNLAEAGLPIDITIPDDTKMGPGTHFSKTWRLKNVGSCTWTRLYALTFFSGNSLSAQYTHYLLQPVEPGETVDLTVDMIAPEQVGVYQSNWMLRDPDDALFGIGPHGDAPFWVRIEVVQVATETPHPTPSLTVTPPVYITGEALLANSDKIDLDKAILNPADDDLADLQYHYGGTPAHLLTPLNGMEWAAYGDFEPGLAQCSAAAINNNTIGFSTVPVGTYFCYRTSEGLWGWLRIEWFADEKLMISFLTWAVH